MQQDYRTFSPRECGLLASTLATKYLRQEGFEFRKARRVLYAIAYAGCRGHLLELCEKMKTVRHLAVEKASSFSQKVTSPLCDDLRSLAMEALLSKTFSGKLFANILEILVFALGHARCLENERKETHILSLLASAVRHEEDSSSRRAA